MKVRVKVTARWVLAWLNDWSFAAVAALKTCLGWSGKGVLAMLERGGGGKGCCEGFWQVGRRAGRGVEEAEVEAERGGRGALAPLSLSLSLAKNTSFSLSLSLSLSHLARCGCSAASSCGSRGSRFCLNVLTTLCSR